MLSRVHNVMNIGQPDSDDGDNLRLASGTTVPADGTAGYVTGCLFLHTDGSAGTTNYQNEGTAASSAFVAVAALTAAQEALLSATAGVATASKALILDSGGDLTSGSIILSDLPTTAGVGITVAADSFVSGVQKVGTLFKTTIVLEVDGLNGGGTADDIIGDDGTGAAHLGQITAARNGTIFAGSMTCLEAPSGEDADIDLHSADEATGVEDTAISALSNVAKLVNAGDWTAGALKPLTLFPAADQYLYLTNGDVTTSGGLYSGGIFLIELWGK